MSRRGARLTISSTMVVIARTNSTRWTTSVPTFVSTAPRMRQKATAAVTARWSESLRSSSRRLLDHDLVGDSLTVVAVRAGRANEVRAGFLRDEVELVGVPVDVRVHRDHLFGELAAIAIEHRE